KLSEPAAIAGSDEATRSLVGGGAAAPRTEDGVVLGTIAYMSPEQAEGKDVDARSDIFSFGSVLYEMITGQRAFRAESAAATLAAVLREEPKSASQIVPEIPKELDRIVQRCLRKDADRRFHNMSDVKVELEEVQEESHSGVTMAPAPVSRKKARW